MWSIIGTAVCGRGHERKNVPVQDKIYFQKGETTVIALADGAGSARLSHFGAEKAVETVCRLLQNHFDQIFHTGDVTNAQQFIMNEILLQLDALSSVHQEPVSEFASTLLAVAVKNNQVLVVHLGDGEIGAIKNGEMKVLSTSDNGEYANATFFTTSANATKQLKLFKSSAGEQFSAFFLMSDGAAHSLFSKRDHKFSPFIEKLAAQSKVHREEVLNRLLTESFEKLVKQRTNDDCSLIMMTAIEEVPGYLKLSQADKELIFSALKSPKHCSIRKWDSIVEILKTPSTFSQIVKKMHLRKPSLKANLRALESFGFIKYEHRKYYLVETSGTVNEN